MAKQIISKNISFDNLKEFYDTMKVLIERKSVSNINFSGNVTKAGEEAEGIAPSLNFNLVYKEEETF